MRFGSDKLRSLREALAVRQEAPDPQAGGPGASLWQRFLTVPLRIITAVIQDFLQGQLTLRAMSLVYISLLSMVPLIAISFSVLKGFGVHNRIEPFLKEALKPLGAEGIEITNRIIEFVDRIEVGVLGFVGFLLLFYTVVSLLQKVERSFNYIWHVPTERSIAHKFRDYLSAVILGPVLVIGATGIIASLMSSTVMQSIAGFGPMGVLIEIAGRLTSFALVVGAMTFLYAFLPNTQVRLGPAALGGLVAGAMWALTGWGFASFIVGSAAYTVIYSVFATLVLFMIWLYLVWLIVLMGSAVSFYSQNPHYIGIKREAVQYGIKAMERVALIAVYHIVRSWYKGEAPWTAERLARETHVPMPALSQVIGALEKAGLIERGGDDQPTFLPACPPEDTPVKAVLDALRADAGTGHPAVGRGGSPDAVEELLSRMDCALSAEFERETLKSFALNGAAPEQMVKSAAGESGGV